MIDFDEVFKASDCQKITRNFVNALVKSKQQSVPIFIENNPNLVIGTM